MSLRAKADRLLAQQPLPDDAPAQLDALINQATGAEQEFLIMYYEALYNSATPEQLAIWNADPQEPEED